MKILGLDPGPERSGLVLVNVTTYPRTRAPFWSARVAHADQAVDNDTVLDLLYNGARWVGAVDTVVIETLSPRGQVVGHSTFNSLVMVGRMFEAAHSVELVCPSVELLGRDDIKRTLLGKINVAGADKHLRQLMLDRVGPKGRKAEPGPTYGVSGHAWQALAAVVAYLDRLAGEG